MKKTYVYVAGPYTEPDPAVNVKKAVLMGRMLRGLGYIPYVPHLTHLWHLIEAHDYSYWLRFHQDWLVKCDAVLVMPGESKGAEAEADLAILAGIPVFFSLEDLVQWTPN